jgi:hypothetical protein
MGARVPFSGFQRWPRPVIENSSFSEETERSSAAVERERRFVLLVALLARGGRGSRSKRGRAAQGPGRERHMDDERPVVTEANKDRVRAGVTGHNVRYVLLAGCALVVVAYLFIYFIVK